MAASPRKSIAPIREAKAYRDVRGFAQLARRRAVLQIGRGAGAFGRAFAKAPLAEGANVALADVDEPALARAVEDLQAPP
jgi:NAD(P)-dependent dehydrogenase (short-subunit alcohol dehydrogenase family)